MLTDTQIEAAMGPCDDSDLARGVRAQFVAAFKRVYSRLHPPSVEPVAQAEPLTERDHFDLARWHMRLGELSDAYYEAGRTDPARQRARAALMMHALDCATGWRARSKAAATPQAQPTTPERAWLVEWRWNGTQWLCLTGRRFSFTSDPNTALRFARRADADSALAWVNAHECTGWPRRLGEMLVTEHQWGLTP